jgi:DNA-binding MarR family transcriptional regulator
VDGLVQRGAVKRQEDPSDRRSKLVSVSARGRAIYERVVRVRVAGVERFVEKLEPDQRDALEAALGPIVEGLGR